MQHMLETLKGLLFGAGQQQLSGSELLRKAKALVAGLPLIAQAMVDDGGKRIRLRKGPRPGGATDGTTVWIQDTVIPKDTLSEDDFVVLIALQLGLVHHEIGHVNHTDFSAKRSPGLAARLSNLFEDMRQEAVHVRRNKMGQQYLHALQVATLITGLNAPVQKGEHPLGILTGYILFRCRAEFRQEPWYGPLADQAEAAFEEAFPKGIALRLDALLDRVPKLASTQDAIDLANEVVSFLEGEKRAEEEANQAPDADADADADADPDAADQSASSPDEPPPSSGAQGSASGGQPSPQAQALAEVLADDAEGGAGDLDERVRAAIEELTGKVQSRSHCTTLQHDLDLGASSTHPLLSGEEVDLNAALCASGAIRSKLRQLLEAQCATQERVGTRGNRLSGKHLVRAQLNDPRIFRRVSSGVAVDTAVVLVGDVSPSMDGLPLQLLNQALFAASTALSSLEGVETGIVAFPGRQVVLNFGQSPTRYRERFTLAIAGGGTPLEQGVMQALHLLRTSRKARKLMVVLTDGEPNDADTAAAALDLAESQGVETFGVGIMTMAVEDLFRRHVVIDDVHQLPTQLMGLLKDQLLAA